MTEGRIVIVPFLQGKVTSYGTVIEPDIDAILEQWRQRHPEFRDRDFHVIRSKCCSVGEPETPLVRVTTDFSPDLADYDPAEDADLYADFLPDDEGSTLPLFRKVWVQQCEVAERIEAEYGTEKSMGYLIGEKLLNFLGVAETKPEWRAEVPHFIAKIKKIFEPWQIAEFFETPRRLGALGHAADEDENEMLRSQMEESEKVREDARNLMLFEWARELLLDDEASS